MSDALIRPPSLLALPSYLASQVSQYGRLHLESVLEDHGLGLGHHAVLAALDDFGPLSQQQLANHLDCDKSHLVSRIDLLEGRDLLVRRPDPHDRRRYQVTLTDAGRRFIAQLRPVEKRSQRRFLDPLTGEEQQVLVSLLRRVLDANDAARGLDD